MRTNLLKQRVHLQIKTSTAGPLGSTDVWSPVGDYWCRLIPLDVKTITAYQQQNTVVSHTLELGGKVTVSIGQHRIKIGSYTYYPAVSAKHLEDMTVLVVNQS